MKFLLLPLIAVLSIARGHNDPDQIQGRDIEENHQLKIMDPEVGIKFEEWNNSAKERAVCGRPSILCTLAGGECINRGDDCEGIKDPSGCSGRRCACCSPVPKNECTGCPVEDGFFIPTGSRQCFKFFPEPGRNWMEANALCTEKGLVLAHPYDALGLRDYLLQRYGRWGYVWVNACGDDSEIIWQDNGKMLGQDSPLWRPNEPKNLTSDYCMVLSASDVNWKNIPDQIYSVYNHADKFQVLCEFPLTTPLVTPPTTNSSTGMCPDGFLPLESQCIMYVKERKNWDDARSHCQNNSADLVQPNDIDALRTFLIDHPPLSSVSWIGIRREGGVLKWLNGTEAPVIFSHVGDCVFVNPHNDLPGGGNNGLATGICAYPVGKWFVCEYTLHN